LVPEADGCVMWDCVPLATREAIDYVRSLGGLKAIAVSHPHYYGAVADWSEAFGGVPVYLHGDDRALVTRPHSAIVPWTGDSHRLSDDILLVRTGGHFAGGTILHWRAGAQGRGALLTGDVAMVAMDRRSLSFMYSFPNYIPLNATAVRRIWACGRTAGVRSHLRRMVGPQCRRQRQGGFRNVRPAVYRGDLRLKAAAVFCRRMTAIAFSSEAEGPFRFDRNGNALDRGRLAVAGASRGYAARHRRRLSRRLREQSRFWGR
jgi:hypothetical protein